MDITVRAITDTPAYYGPGYAYYGGALTIGTIGKSRRARSVVSGLFCCAVTFGDVDASLRLI